METVVITGSSRGLGFELAKQFKEKNYNVVINGVNQERLEKAANALNDIAGDGNVLVCAGSVTDIASMQNLADQTRKQFGQIDIWINNAGVNQPDKAIWELSEDEVQAIFDTDLLGTVNGSKVAMNVMKEQHQGAIYNMEGHGSNGAIIMGLSLYGTSKSAVSYFTKALAKESEERKTGVIVGRLSPGIMITDFTQKALGGAEKILLSEKTKKVYNILGDYPDVVAEFLVNKMIVNNKNDVQIEWLTSKKAAWRFMTAGFRKRDFFTE